MDEGISQPLHHFHAEVSELQARRRGKTDRTFADKQARFQVERDTVDPNRNNTRAI